MQPGTEKGPTDRKPWLRNAGWAAREFGNDRSNVAGWPLVGVAYLVGGGLSFVFIASGLGLMPGASNPGGEISPLSLAVGGMFLAMLGALTYVKIRHERFGESVCRLVTLPGVIGGWFKADVECGLPSGSAPLVVRLRNFRQRHKGRVVLWSMQKQIHVTPSPLPGSDRFLVPVRIQIPRHPWQVPDPLDAGFWTPDTYWMLEIEKKCRGVDFFAKFRVPIYDIPDALESEQRAE